MSEIIFSKVDLLAALRPTIEEMEVDGFGTVAIKQLTVRESDALRANLKKDDDSSEFGLRLLGVSMIDKETGARIFSDDEMDSLREASGPKIETLIKRVLEINNYRKADQEKN